MTLLKFENKILYGHINKSKKHRGVGHATFVDPTNGMNYVKWRASKQLQIDIDITKTSDVILIKVKESKKKDPQGNEGSYYLITEIVVTKEDGSQYLKNL